MGKRFKVVSEWLDKGTESKDTKTTEKVDPRIYSLSEAKKRVIDINRNCTGSIYFVRAYHIQY